MSILPSLAFLLEPASIAALMALSSSGSWPLLWRRQAILVVQVAGSLLFGQHYLLLGGSTTAAMCVMGALRVSPSSR